MDYGMPFISRAVGLAAALALGLGVAACGKSSEEAKADQYPAVQSEQPAPPSGTMGSAQNPPPETVPAEPMPGTEGQATEETPLPE